MMSHFHTVKAQWKIALLAFAFLSLPAPQSAADEARPPAQELLELVRLNQSAQDQRFTGRLRSSNREGRIVVPFQLTMQGGSITYQFQDPAETIAVQMGENDSRLSVSGGKAGGLSTPVRGTDVTYEDIALKFLYWTNAKTMGRQLVGSRDCWVVQAVPPSPKASQYDLVRLWVEKSGALLKAECYKQGKLIRRFEVRNVQRNPHGKGYILKTMRITQVSGGEDRSPTYLEVKPL